MGYDIKKITPLQILVIIAVCCLLIWLTKMAYNCNEGMDNTAVLAAGSTNLPFIGNFAVESTNLPIIGNLAVGSTNLSMTDVINGVPNTIDYTIKMLTSASFTVNNISTNLLSLSTFIKNNRLSPSVNVLVNGLIQIPFDISASNDPETMIKIAIAVLQLQDTPPTTALYTTPHFVPLIGPNGNAANNAITYATQMLDTVGSVAKNISTNLSRLATYISNNSTSPAIKVLLTDLLRIPMDVSSSGDGMTLLNIIGSIQNLPYSPLPQTTYPPTTPQPTTPQPTTPQPTTPQPTTPQPTTPQPTTPQPTLPTPLNYLNNDATKPIYKIRASIAGASSPSCLNQGNVNTNVARNVSGSSLKTMPCKSNTYTQNFILSNDGYIRSSIDPSKCLKYWQDPYDHTHAPVINDFDNCTTGRSNVKVNYDPDTKHLRVGNGDTKLNNVYCVNVAGGSFAPGSVVDYYPCAAARQDTVSWTIDPVLV